MIADHDGIFYKGSLFNSLPGVKGRFVLYYGLSWFIQKIKLKSQEHFKDFSS
jgi:hypothetical protein